MTKLAIAILMIASSPAMADDKLDSVNHREACRQEISGLWIDTKEEVTRRSTYIKELNLKIRRYEENNSETDKTLVKLRSELTGKDRYNAKKQAQLHDLQAKQRSVESAMREARGIRDENANLLKKYRETEKNLEKNITAIFKVHSDDKTQAKKHARSMRYFPVLAYKRQCDKFRLQCLASASERNYLYAIIDTLPEKNLEKCEKYLSFTR